MRNNLKSENNSPNLHAEFSLDKRIPQPELPSQRQSSAIWWCRFILWLCPGPAWLIMTQVTIALGINTPVIQILLAIIILPSIGYCDSILSSSISKQSGIPVLKDALFHCLKFTLIQTVIAPCSMLIFWITIIAMLYF